MPDAPNLPTLDGRRLAVLAVATLLVAYVAAFVADGRRVTGMLVVDAAANSLAGVAAAALAVGWCRVIPWRLANRWLFLPAHAAGMLAFGAAWVGSTALAVGAAAMLRGRPFEPFVLGGAARNWQLVTAGALYLAIVATCYVMQRLDAACFVRVHRSHIVNLRAIMRIVPHGVRRLAVEFPDGSRVVSSRAGAARLRSRMR